ncbi:NACHT domain-containing protein [Micromonospora sp. DT227]|uniref:NACHT domain-containing protein n=1 Tax=Micromonospora sp. DT227 TaxID=3393433 RepID=UPI003CEA1C58
MLVAWRSERLRDSARPALSVKLSSELLEELSGDQLAGLQRYVSSPDFDEVALHVTLAELLPNQDPDEVRSAVRSEIVEGIRHFASLDARQRLSIADLLEGSLGAAVSEQAGRFSRPLVDAASAAGVAHLASMAARKGELLAKVENLHAFNDFARSLQSQVVELHGELQLPHLGNRKTVPYDQLYVDPPLEPQEAGVAGRPLLELLASSRRLIVLGNPGAGKSTMAAKLAFDTAADSSGIGSELVPFLVVLRNHMNRLSSGGRTLIDYLKICAADPHNLVPPADSIEYLVTVGRAVVILDGLDELIEAELRRRVVKLIEGFASAYPLAIILVTARSVGYDDAPFNSRQFSHARVCDFDDERVTQYVQRWFALDEHTPEAERRRLTESFLRESSSVPDLRRNPLLLSLLCGMYSSEGYIPQNMVEAYEHCALLLFRYWDNLRGIKGSSEFHARLRGAVQYLAFEQLGGASNFGSSSAIPRRRVVASIATYLTAKHFDHDEAVKTAEEFLDFCTGRAWILSDVDTINGQPAYGFTHRTFLEYFAAEYIVRTRGSLSELHSFLRDRISGGRFHVVGQIVLQLFDRVTDDGADELIRLLIGRMPSGEAGEAALVAFACRALSHVMLSPHTMKMIIRAAILIDVRERLARSGHRSSPALGAGASYGLLQSAISSVILDGMPANARHITSAIETVLAESDTSSGLAAFIVQELSRRKGAIGRP